LRVLIVGSDTPVGLALAEYLEQRETQFLGLPRADCRWKSERQVKKALRRSECDLTVDTRLQAAADGGIRIHDADIDRSLWLARASQASKIPFILLSHALVFSGSETREYREDDYPDGESTIAQLLIAAEMVLRDNCEQHVILRTGPVFAPVGINIATQLLEKLREGGVLALNRRQHGCPLAAEDAARIVSAVIDQLGCGMQAWGIYHYSSPDITNCYEFTEVLLAAASQYEDFSTDVVQLAADEAQETETRSLDCSKIRNSFAIKQQSWRSSVAGQVKKYYSELKVGEAGGGESDRHNDAGA
jgi:dTDP-4-dehydrorhamnose reductase